MYADQKTTNLIFRCFQVLHQPLPLMYKYVSRKYIFQFIDNLSPEGGSKANSLNVYGMYCNRMSIAEGCVLGLSLI